MELKNVDIFSQNVVYLDHFIIFVHQISKSGTPNFSAFIGQIKVEELSRPSSVFPFSNFPFVDHSRLNNPPYKKTYILLG